MGKFKFLLMFFTYIFTTKMMLESLNAPLSAHAIEPHTAALKMGLTQIGRLTPKDQFPFFCRDKDDIRIIVCPFK